MRFPMRTDTYWDDIILYLYSTLGIQPIEWAGPLSQMPVQLTGLPTNLNEIGLVI